MFDPVVVETLLQRIRDYENWIQQGADYHQFAQTHVPPGYQTIFAQSEEAYSFYRHSLIFFLKEIKEESYIYRELLDLTFQTIDSESVDYSGFNVFVDSLYDKFKARWNNAFQSSLLFSKLEMQKLELNHVSLSAYQDRYEIDEVLIYFAVLRKVISNNIFDTDLKNLRDKSGKLRKGVAVDYIISGINSFPILKETISKAYLPRVRNSFGHNDYVINNGSLFTLNHDLLANNSDFIEAFYNIQELHNALIWAISYIKTTENIETQFDCGVLSIGYLYNEDLKIPEIQLFQLWCFFQFDSEKKWLQKVRVCKEHNMVTTTITNKCTISGEIMPDIYDWLEKIKTNKDIQVTIIPIIPYIGAESFTATINGERYQIYEEPYSVRVAVELKEL